MDKPGIEELLIACVLDPHLLQELRESRDSVIAQYNLSDHERELLASPDERLLDLLGAVVQGQAADRASSEPNARDVSATTPIDGSSTTVTALPESRLAVRLVPYLQQAAETGDTSPVKVMYAGHLDNLPAGTEVEDLADVPPAAAAGQPLPQLAMTLTIQPQIRTDTSGGQQITFSLSAILPRDPGGPEPTIASEESDSEDLTPWQHDMDSAAVSEAATLVRAATADDRHARLLDLIEHMVAPGSAPEAGR